jgi:putative membrane protein
MILLGLVVTAVVYLRGWLRLRADAMGRIPHWRAGCFLAGLASIGIASASPLAHCDAGSLTVHMVQHLLLQTIAPPLIFFGEPLRALGHGLPPRAVRALDRPAICWLAATVTLMGWHVPAAFTLALHSHAWHALEQLSFLATGLLFWWPVVRPWPADPTSSGWSTVLYLFLATLPCDVLSGFLVFSDRVAYPAYLAARPAAVVLGDQQCAGALMWTVVTVVYLAAGAILSVRLLTPSVPQGEVA